MHHFTYGWLTPLLSFVMACVGGALGLRCTVRALAASGTPRRNWLVLASLAIGSGIWTMHFVAMLGFGVSGSPIRYDVPLTVLSPLVAIAVVGAGVFTAGYGRSRNRSILVGGLGTGLGVAAMHYIGMAALRLHGDIGYDPLLVVVSVLIAMAAASAALWAALTVQGATGAVGASLVMGLAVSSMHHTGMAAVSVRLTPGQTGLPGATATVVAVNCFAGCHVYAPQEVRAALDLQADTPVVLCDARERESAKDVLIALVEHAGRVYGRAAEDGAL